MNRVSAAIQKTALLFTYSLSSSNDDAFDANVFPAQLACAVEYGVYSKVSYDDDLTDALSSYYRLFALGLGSQDQNDTFVAWVEPYVFATSNTMGTTVSRPVYNRTSDPPIFLGVVGIDISLRALDAALSSGTTTSKDTISQEVIRRIVNPSNNRCPRELNLTTCELEAYQASSHSYHRLDDDEKNRSISLISFCGRGCADPSSVSVQETVCVWDGGFYPNDLWNNTQFHLQETSYTDRFCCKNNTAESTTTPAEEDVCLAAAVTTSRPTDAPTGSLKHTDSSFSDDEKSKGSNDGDTSLHRGAIAGIALLAVAVMFGLLLYAWKRGVFTRGESSPSSIPITLPPPATNPSYAMWDTTAPTAPSRLVSHAE
jgi:hypothetical protein